jgi:hypothetical protein
VGPPSHDKGEEGKVPSIPPEGGKERIPPHPPLLRAGRPLF